MIISEGYLFDRCPVRHLKEQTLDLDIQKRICLYEDAADVTVTVIYQLLTPNVMSAKVTVSANTDGRSLIFTSLNLWQVGEKNYVYNMQDGKVSGFATAIFDRPVETPLQFVDYILQDLFDR